MGVSPTHQAKSWLRDPRTRKISQPDNPRKHEQLHSAK